MRHYPDQNSATEIDSMPEQLGSRPTGAAVTWIVMAAAIIAAAFAGYMGAMLDIGMRGAADRATVEFDAVRAVIRKATGGTP